MVQWLGLCAPSAGGPGWIPRQGTWSHMPQLRGHVPKLKVLCATTTTWHRQVNSFCKKSLTFCSKVIFFFRGFGKCQYGRQLFFSVCYFFSPRSLPHLAWDSVISIEEGIWTFILITLVTIHIFYPRNNLLFPSSLWFVLEGKVLSTR